MKTKSIGIDIGGTTVKIAIFEKNGTFISKWEIPTNTKDNGCHIIKGIAVSIDKNLIELNINKEEIIGAGVGAPGFIDYENGVIALAPNLGWHNYPIVKQLEMELDLPVTIENDANLAAIGEMWQGAGKGHKNILAITLGTGVGGGVIIDGKVVQGTNGMAGEIGHITADYSSEIVCGCGRKGCLETIASARGIARLGEEMVEYYSDSTSLCENEGNLTAKDVFDAAKNGDTYADEAVNQAMKHLAKTIANIAHTVNPEMVIIGGGVSKAGDFLTQKIDNYLKEFMLPRAYEILKLRIATLGNDAGVIGGAYLANLNQ